MKPSRHFANDRDAMHALAQFGNADRAAAELKIHPDTLRRRVQRYCAAMGFDSPVQAAYWLDRVDEPSSFPRKTA